MYSGEEIGVIIFELARAGRNTERAARVLRDAGGRFASINETTMRRMRDKYRDRIESVEAQIVERTIARRLEGMGSDGK